MKNVAIIVFVVVALVLVGAVSYQAMVVAPRAAEKKDVLRQYNFQGNDAAGKKPSSGFSVGSDNKYMQQGKDPEINGMLQTLEQTNDDGGASDLQQLNSDAQGL